MNALMKICDVRYVVLALALLVSAIISTPVAAQTGTVTELIAFSSGPFSYPNNTVQGRNGLLYGTLGASGNAGNYGVVYDYTPSGVTHTLYTAPAAAAYGGLTSMTLMTDGNFYGAVSGAAVIGTGAFGNIFKVTPNGTFTVLHYFNGTSDGAFPETTPIEGNDGNLYGVTNGGCCTRPTIYKYTRSGQFSTVYTYTATQGNAAGSLLQGTDGNLLVTSRTGGAFGDGTILKISTGGLLLSEYDFAGKTGGNGPLGLALASDGNYYGGTYSGGTVGFGYGTIFRLTPAGKVTVIYAFNPAQTKNDGAYPDVVSQGTDGYLYGVTAYGGTYNAGTIFRVSLQGAYSQLYSFPSSVGQYPAGFLTQATTGLFYGTATTGGTYGLGSIFSLDMGLGPFVTFVQPVGKVGKTAEILGQGFTSTKSVTFNGVAASSFSVVSDTYMTAVVPTGATTGPVVVTTPTQTLTSNVSFRIRN